MKNLVFILILFLLIFIYGCSQSQETARSQETLNDSTNVYVFDDVQLDVKEETDIVPEKNEMVEENEAEDTKETEPTISQQPEKVEFYIVQVGAFTSEERAKKFIEENQKLVDSELNYHFSDKVKLHVVQLPPFRTREEAEAARNRLWQTAQFKDAFIVPIE
ncbi:MAG: SPOR domain-containing protein [Melioribacteraceae bacterium]|nr:SPOR domain-containing protein [Melioribacteraceae bacterium]